MKRHDLRAAITGRILPAFIALALLTTCRNGGDPSRTGTRSTPESTNGNDRTTASGNSSATEEKALLSIYEYNKLDTVFMEDFPAIGEPEEDTVCVVTHRMPSFPVRQPDGFHPPKRPLSEQSRAGKYPGSDLDQMRYR